MKSLSQKTILLLVSMFSFFFTSTANAQAFWEIPDPNFKYIAMVRKDPSWGYAVVYNSTICEKIGEACAFFRAHEYAHWFHHDLYLHPDEYPTVEEDRADCWAAKYIKPEQAEAAAQLLSDSEAIKDLPIYGDPVHRVDLIRKCAKEGGTWLGGHGYSK